ncbi:hypothetical protein AVEN_221183-1 [Araneus ventricosus]|uniref:Uncharacterized protein n=1 Tax=Araneus ventricosus TaxID=182803 RepID=A0A4Y2I4V6_ARAVE|nr:hypothetical protein AVEN_221183-1 [Araneus ventricosus]
MGLGFPVSRLQLLPISHGDQRLHFLDRRHVFDPSESHRPLSQIKNFLNFVYCHRPRPGAPQSLNGRLIVSVDIDTDPIFQSSAHRKSNCSQLSLKNADGIACNLAIANSQSSRTIFRVIREDMGEFAKEMISQWLIGTTYVLVHMQGINSTDKASLSSRGKILLLPLQYGTMTKKIMYAKMYGEENS